MEDNLPTTALSTLSLLPESKEQVQRFAESIRLSVLSGQSNPLEVLARIKAVENTIKEVLEVKEIKDLARDEAEKYGERSFDYRGFRVELAEISPKYNYEGTGCPIWARLKEQADKATQALKDRETELKAMKSTQEIVDPDSGEIVKVNPPVKSSTSGLKFSLK